MEAEDNMNCQMENITVTYRDGREAQLENVYIRGSKIRFLILPDMLKNAPMFKRPGGKGSGTAGRGKSAILRAQGVSIGLKIFVWIGSIRISLDDGFVLPLAHLIVRFFPLFFVPSRKLAIVHDIVVIRFSFLLFCP